MESSILRGAILSVLGRTLRCAVSQVLSRADRAAAVMAPCEETELRLSPRMRTRKESRTGGELGARSGGAPARGPSQTPLAQATHGPLPERPGEGVHSEEELEFGGWKGALALMIWSHCMPLYMWMSLEFYRGSLFFGPTDWHNMRAWSDFFAGDLLPKLAQAYPTAEAWSIYAAFFLSQVVLFFVCPGIKVFGLPVPAENNRRFVYYCNAFTSWVVTLLAVFALHYSGLFSIGVVSRLRGQLIVVSMVTADVIALAIYVAAVFVFKNGYKMTGNHLYDFFMGAWLNPRIGSLDLKLWAEVKMSWVTLFLLVLGSAVQQYENLGGLTNGMVVIVFAQLLYSNACMKGEECVCTTWDIFAEKWGWMLIYWNFCGVPFVYTFQAEYLNRASAGASLATVPDISTPFAALLCAICFVAYYVWDTSQQQKNTYRLMQRGDFQLRRWWTAFPQLPGGILHKQYGADAWKHCRVLTFEDDSSGKRLTLLVDGVWKYGRKIHYGMDIIMAMVWAGSTVGASPDAPHLLNFFYPLFFTSMIIHRWQRDDQRCRQKYGDKNWSAYCKEVPYVFFPGLY